MSVEVVLQRLVTGLLVGSIYGLLCSGIGMIFGVMRVINFAQGEFMMLGMYVTLFVGAFGATALLGATVGAYAGVLCAGVVLAGVGWLVHRFLMSRVSGVRVSGSDNEGHFAQLILTLGLSLTLSNGALLLFGSSPQAIQTPLASSSWIVELPGDTMLFVNKARLVGCLMAGVIAVALYVFVNRTRAGTSMRAAADNAAAATVVGIDVGRAYSLAFAIGSAVTAVAGGLIATYYPFNPYIGFEFIIIMYAGVVLGGMGSILGAFWGGMAIGLVQQLSTLVLPYQLQNATIFVLFLAVVLWRPEGLFGRSAERA